MILFRFYTNQGDISKISDTVKSCDDFDINIYIV